MQHLGVDQGFIKAMHDLWESMTPEEREEFWPLQVRVKGVSPEDLLRALTPEDLERLRQLLRSQTRSDDSSPSR
jgi:hypothetical protein